LKFTSCVLSISSLSPSVKECLGSARTARGATEDVKFEVTGESPERQGRGRGRGVAGGLFGEAVHSVRKVNGTIAMAGIEKAAWALFGCVGPANWGPRSARVVVQWQGGVVGLGGWSCRNGRPARCFGALKLEDARRWNPLSKKLLLLRASGGSGRWFRPSGPGGAVVGNWIDDHSCER
jgi:hypothetical protein